MERWPPIVEFVGLAAAVALMAWGMWWAWRLAF